MVYINTEIVLIAPLLCHGIYKYRESLLFHCYVMVYINTESPYCSTVMSWYIYIYINTESVLIAPLLCHGIYIYKYREYPYCSTVMSWYYFSSLKLDKDKNHC